MTESAHQQPGVPAADGSLQVIVDDCWSRIGVNGDGSCPELKHLVHCRNCPVYASAGAQLLERNLSPDYRREWAAYFSRPKFALTPGAISVVLFRIGSEWLALPTPAFHEVAERRRIHSIPHRRKGTLLGLVNVRGELLVCVSLARVLAVEHDTASGNDRMVYGRWLVTSWDSKRLVFPADEVHGVHRFEPDQLRDPPATLTKSGTSYTKGVLTWHGRMVLCLDAELLFPALSESLA